MPLSQPSTQSFVKIESLRDGVVFLRGGAMRSVLRVSSLNFSLKSQEEQTAIILEYQNFLNSLDFPIQIYINSRFLNIDNYVETLEEMERGQTNELLKLQTKEYIDFIKEFVENTDIVSTDFFVVVPITAYEAQGRGGGVFGAFSSLFGGGKPQKVSDERFSHYRTQLMQRTDFIAAGLHRMGLTTRMLTTEELIKFFWNIYNPQGLKKGPLIKPAHEK